MTSDDPDLYAPEIAAALAGHVSVDPDGAITPTTAAPPNLDTTSDGARRAIFRALGYRMIPVAPGLSRKARALSRILADVATGEAPEELVEVAERVVAAWSERPTFPRK